MLEFDTHHIAELLGERFADQLQDDKVSALATEHPKRLCLRVLIDTRDGARRWIFEAGVSRPAKKRDEAQARRLVVNFVDAYLSEWFAQDRALRPPLNFTTHDFEGATVFLRGRRRDLNVERMAAALLGEPLEPDLDEVD